jgi:hypothetical protein
MVIPGKVLQVPQRAVIRQLVRSAAIMPLQRTPITRKPSLRRSMPTLRGELCPRHRCTRHTGRSPQIRDMSQAL